MRRPSPRRAANYPKRQRVLEISFNSRLPVSLYERLASYAIDRDIPIKEALADALEKYLKRRGA